MCVSLNFLGAASTTSGCFIEILQEIQIWPNFEGFTIIKDDEFWWRVGNFNPMSRNVAYMQQM